MPTVEQPLREAEFDAVFAEAARGVERIGPERIRVVLEPTADVAARVADLAVRETGCCLFFTFQLTAGAGTLHLDVSVSGSHVDVLDALAAKASRSGPRAGTGSIHLRR